MTNPDEELLDEIAIEAEQAEHTRDVELSYQRRRSAGGSRVYGLRLPVERIEQLRRVAQARGMDPSTLVRQWVIAQLDEAEESGNTARERWERDLRATTEHLRRLLDERPGA
jgi:aryl-alcohol dehydrogenase-like predicted oxidoreductase